MSQADRDARYEAFGYADRFDEKYDLVRTLRKGRYEYIRNFQPFNFDGLQNNYRYRMLAFEEWRQLYQDGKLNEVQKQFFETRPVEQLFDIEADPHETRNLADDPQYQTVLRQLRARMNERLVSMPDLSLYPESVLAERAFSNPVRFGRRNRATIRQLLNTANLQLGSFADAKASLAEALESDDANVRYWALIACTTHGSAAAEFAQQARSMAAGDPDGLVRVRAAEFLGLTRAGDPVPSIVDALKKSSSGIEAGLMLNTVTLLRDTKPGYDFEITPDLFSAEHLKNDTVQRRLEYLAP